MEQLGRGCNLPSAAHVHRAGGNGCAFGLAVERCRRGAIFGRLGLLLGLGELVELKAADCSCCLFLLLLLSTDIHCLLLLFAPLRSQWILANGGEAPWIIVVDLSRSDEKTPWAAIEAIKNGEISSGKYHSTVESFRRPHVVMLANRPADNVGVEMSRDRVVEVEVHRFIEELDGAPTAPTTVAELRTFPGVKTFGDLVPPSPARGPVARQMVAAEDQANADLHREEDEVPPSPARAAVDVAMALGECGPVARQMVAAEEDADDDDDQWVRESPHAENGI